MPNQPVNNIYAATQSMPGPDPHPYILTDIFKVEKEIAEEH